MIMRDETVMATFAEFQKRIGSDIGLVLRSVAVVETRQKALEAFLFSGRLQLLKLALLAILSPARVRTALSMVHGRMLNEYEDKLKAAFKAKNEKSIIKPVLVGVAAVCFMLVSGCVPRAKYARAVKDLETVKTFYNGLAEAASRQTARADFCEEQQTKLVEVLRKFNQIDEKGNLRKGIK